MRRLRGLFSARGPGKPRKTGQLWRTARRSRGLISANYAQIEGLFSADYAENSGGILRTRMPEGRVTLRGMQEIDIWRTANLLIEQHGAQAIVVAAQRQVAILQNGDEDGARVWLRVIRSIDQLMRQRPENGGRVS